MRQVNNLLKTIDWCGEIVFKIGLGHLNGHAIIQALEKQRPVHGCKKIVTVANKSDHTATMKVKKRLLPKDFAKHENRGSD